MEVSSCASLHLPLVFVMLSKPSRVPEPASRPMHAMSPLPPNADQLVASPVKMAAMFLDLVEDLLVVHQVDFQL